MSKISFYFYHIGCTGFEKKIKNSIANSLKIKLYLLITVSEDANVHIFR